MSQYYGYTHSSYFHVLDEAKFRAVMAEVITDDAEIDIWKRTDDDGKDIFAFGCYSQIRGICPTGYDPDGDNDPDYDHFIQKLQECLAEDDVVAIKEIGYEKLRYLAADVCIVAKHASKYIDFETGVIIPAMDELAPNRSIVIRMDY